MISEKKIFLDRNDDIRFAVDRLINAPASRVILNVPRESRLSKSLENFQILKRESVTAGKSLVIESVDDHVLELAALAKLEGLNPIFRIKERAVADILPRYTLDRKKTSVLEAIDREPVKETRFFDGEPAHRPQPKRKRSFRGLAISLVILVFLSIGAFFLATDILPRATISLTLKKTNADFRENVEISSRVAEADITNSQKILLPGELLVASKNLELAFDAHGREKVETKAAGKLIVYNAYSSEPQLIVKSTRFISPEGKVFRLDAPLTIPAAKILNGKIVLSKIEAAVTASEPGPDYNVPASRNWRIPGFAGSPKYEGFYAEAVVPIAGGFIGEQARPTDEDLKLAREKLEQVLRSALAGEIGVLLIDNDLKFLSQASSFKILNEKILSVAGNPEKFTVWGEGELRYFVFKEGMLKEIIAEKLKRNLEPNLRVVNFALNYEDLDPDLQEGRLVLTANGSVQFESNIDIEGLKKNLLGVGEKTLRAKIFTLPGLERAAISLWPFWVKSVPLSVQKVKILAK